MKQLRSARHVALREVLVEARQAAKLTQRQAAARAGRSHPWLTYIERGVRRLDALEMIELAEIYGVRPETLVRRVMKRAASKSGRVEK